MKHYQNSSSKILLRVVLPFFMMRKKKTRMIWYRSNGKTQQFYVDNKMLFYSFCFFFILFSRMYCFQTISPLLFTFKQIEKFLFSVLMYVLCMCIWYLPSDSMKCRKTSCELIENLSEERKKRAVNQKKRKKGKLGTKTQIENRD